MALTAAATWAVVGGTSLAREGQAMQGLLAGPDLPAARSRLSHLCGRDPSGLGPAELARATIESIAENTSDAVVAPVVWGALAGLPGLVGYRAVNTLDAMIGHRTARYERFGWAAARLDDVLNVVPARLTAAALVLTAPTVGGSARQALRVWRRDAAAHPSPNAGPVEASLAGSLGVRLGGTNTYAGRSERRGTLGGEGAPPRARDIDRAVRACRSAAILACLSAVTGSAVVRSVVVRSGVVRAVAVRSGVVRSGVVRSTVESGIVPEPVRLRSRQRGRAAGR